MKFIPPTAQVFSRLGKTQGIWLLLGVTLIYYLTYFNYGIDLDDEGFLLVNATDILHGLWPMADFFSYQPLSYFLLALFFKILGDGVFSERLLLLILLLINIRLIYYSASRLLPLSWALLPAAVYAFAPGPWYKVFFISHILISLAATLHFIERPTVWRAFLAGLTCGLALIGRVEAGVVITIIITVVLYLAAWRNVLSSVTTQRLTVTWLIKGSKFELAFLAGALSLVALMVSAYWANGKLPSLVANVLYYYNYFDSVSYVNTNTGREDMFGISKLFTQHPMEMWVYAIAMTTCMASFTGFSWSLLKSKDSNTRALSGLSVAMFGIGSLGYTYFYVWNSRMLSSFAVVYINFFIVLSLLYYKLSSSPGTVKYARWAALVGALLVLVYLKSFIKVENYSGSYTTRAASMVQLSHPKLANIYVYPGQDKTINDLMNLTQDATDKDFLIPMSEATTLSYLSGLANPTYYRLFAPEFAHRGEKEKAIGQFDQYKIRYFVARRSQFLGGPRVGSDLQSYAPEIRAYLINKYQVTPLGDGFVLLTRKGGV